MKKNARIFTVFLFFSAALLNAQNLKIRAWTDFLSLPVWTFDQGPVPLGEFLGFEIPEISFSYQDYDSSADDGKWIRDLFFGGNIFSVRAPEKYSAISERLQNSDAAEIDEIAGSILRNSAEENPVPEKTYLNEDKTLSLYSYDEENLSVQKTGDGSTLVNSDGKKTVRYYYDEKMRLVKKENWDISGGISSSKIIDFQEFEYSDGSKPFAGTICSDNEKHEILYDQNGRIISSKNYVLFKKDEKKSGKFVLESKTEWKYSESGKILEKYFEEYSYNKNKSKVLGTSTKKDVYEYKIQDGPPDCYFYENEKLRVSTVYSSADSYVTTMNFDGGFVVESYYENGRRKKDLLYLDGIIRSVQNYEK